MTVKSIRRINALSNSSQKHNTLISLIQDYKQHARGIVIAQILNQHMDPLQHL
jgi:hypothetical protein